jgi:putative FmdB family regulatory protein
MPIYEYTCEKCRNNFEKLVFAGDEEEVACPECDSPKVQKIMSCASIQSDFAKSACSTGAGSGGFS